MPKFLLLTGQVGIGKSLFFKKLQRELIANWRASQTEKMTGRNDFLSTLNLQIEMTQKQKYFFSQEEVFILQT